MDKSCIRDDKKLCRQNFIFFYGIKYGKREVFYVLTAVQRLHYSTERVILFPADKRKKKGIVYEDRYGKCGIAV